MMVTECVKLSSTSEAACTPLILQLLSLYVVTRFIHSFTAIKLRSSKSMAVLAQKFHTFMC